MELEPYSYQVKEIADHLTDGISLEITFDQNLSFDDLYRHAAVAIQHNGFIHARILGLNEGKGYNESFPVKSLLILLDISSTVSKRLYWDLCQRSADVLASMPVTAADGKRPLLLSSFPAKWLTNTGHPQNRITFLPIVNMNPKLPL